MGSKRILGFLVKLQECAQISLSNWIFWLAATVAPLFYHINQVYELLALIQVRGVSWLVVLSGALLLIWRSRSCRGYQPADSVHAQKLMQIELNRGI